MTDNLLTAFYIVITFQKMEEDIFKRLKLLWFMKYCPCRPVGYKL